MTGILGLKIGMTRIIKDDGSIVPVTVVECKPNKVYKIKTVEKNGYNALVLGLNKLKKERKTKKFQALKEVRVDEKNTLKEGDDVSTHILDGIEKIDITGIGKGKGFQGVVKRFHFACGPKSHGSHQKREPGSIGARAKPGRVHKGKKLPGHMGVERVTTKGVPIVHLDHENSLVCLKGPVPGAKGSLVILHTN